MRAVTFISLLTAVGPFLPFTAAEDYLYSKRNARLSKRGIDANGNYNISILHVNDIHAHLDEMQPSGTDCVPNRECVGGYARIKTKVDEVRRSRNDSLFLNIGDEFQGTLFYSFYGGEKIAETINQLGFDAFTLGNHEFDGGDDRLAAFINNLTIPVVCANVNFGPSIDVPLARTNIRPFHIIEEHNLALVGVITPDTKTISNVSATTTFSDPITAVQEAVDYLRNERNISRIIAMTHIGYAQDIALARATRGVDLIVGGHSHSLLGNFTNSAGAYPTIERNLDGEDVFIVTAYRYGEYVGHIDVAFNPEGKIVAYTGAPIRLLNTTVEQDPELQAQIDEWREPFDEFAREVVGSTSVELDQTTCQRQECTLGNSITDSMLLYRRNAGGVVDGAFINAGGIRATITAGEITRGEILTAFPFGNSLVDIRLTGEQLWSMLEGIYSRVNSAGATVTSGVQLSSGFNTTYNTNNPVNSRLITLSVGGTPVDFNRTYTLTTLDFVANGGDAFLVAPQTPPALDRLDEVYTTYVQRNSPISAALEGRQTATNQTVPNRSGLVDADGGNGASMMKASISALVVAVVGGVYFASV